MNTCNYKYLGCKILNIILLCFLIPFSTFGQQPCDQNGCIKASLNEFDGSLMVISGYEDIGMVTLPCGYEDLMNLGVLFELEDASNTNPVWSFNGIQSGDPYETISSDTTIIVSVTHSGGSCSCRVVLNEPDQPEANDITTSLCDDDGTVEDYNLSMIDQSMINPSGATITYHASQVDAENGINSFTTRTVVDGSVIFAGVVGNTGCVATAEISFTVGQTPTANPTPNIQTLNCDNPTTTISAMAGGGDGTYTYAWTTNGGNIDGPTDEASITATMGSSASATYAVVVNSNGCPVTESTPLMQDFTEPMLDSPSISTPNGTEVSCSQETLMLTASATSPNSGTLAYQWTTTDGNITTANPNQQTITVDAAGTYTIIVEQTETGCTKETSITTTEIIQLPDQQQPINGLPQTEEILSVHRI